METDFVRSLQSALQFKRSDPFRETVNSEFNKIADRLHEKHGVADLDEFKGQDHYGNLLKSVGGDSDKANDLSVHLLYGSNGQSSLEGRHRAGSPLQPLLRIPRQFATSYADRINTRGGSKREVRFTDLAAGDEGDLPDFDRKGYDVLGERKPKPQSEPKVPRPTQSSGDRNRAFSEKRDGQSDEELGRVLLAYLSKKPGGATASEIAANSLRIPVKRLHQIAKSVGAVAHLSGEGTNPVTTFHQPGTKLPESPRMAKWRELLAGPREGETRAEMAARFGVSKSNLYTAIRTAKKYLAAEKFARTADPLEDTIDRTVSYWADKKNPLPKQSLTEAEIHDQAGKLLLRHSHVPEFHDTAAVLSGSKGSAFVSKDFFGSPLGMKVHKRLTAGGHVIVPLKEGYHILRPPVKMEREGEKEQFAALKPRHSDFLSALRRVRSKQTQSLQELAQTIAKRIGVQTDRTTPAIHDTPTTAASNLAQTISHDHPDKARLAAAWYGLLSQSKSLCVFHVGEGPDQVHSIRANGSGEELRNQLDKHGIHQRTLIPNGNSWNVIVFDPNGQHSQKVKSFASATGLPLKSMQGRGELIGDSSEAAADGNTRDDYRKIIKGVQDRASPQ